MKVDVYDYQYVAPRVCMNTLLVHTLVPLVNTITKRLKCLRS